jgi:flavorubredoxin
MKAMQSRLVKGRRFYAFGSYTWSASSVNLLNKFAESLGFEILGDGLAFPQAYSREKFDASAIAELLVK